MQNEMNRELINELLTESLRQWNDFKEDRQDCTVEDFVEFTKEIFEERFLCEE